MFTLLGGSMGTDSYLGFEPRPVGAVLDPFVALKGLFPMFLEQSRNTTIGFLKKECATASYFCTAETTTLNNQF